MFAKGSYDNTSQSYDNYSEQILSYVFWLRYFGVKRFIKKKRKMFKPDLYKYNSAAITFIPYHLNFYQEQKLR